MSSLQTNSQTLPDHIAVISPAIRELSTAQRKDWIERIFTRLSGIYGSEFTYKWADVDNEELKAEWGDALGGFHADDIAAALHTCRSQPKAPNLPEFAALCRQNMNTRKSPAMAPLSSEERAAAARVANEVSKSLKSKESNAKGYIVNGTLVTVYKQWAVDMIKREAGGEQLPIVSMESWREVLCYPKDQDAKLALESVKKSREVV